MCKMLNTKSSEGEETLDPGCPAKLLGWGLGVQLGLRLEVSGLGFAIWNSKTVLGSGLGHPNNTLSIKLAQEALYNRVFGSKSLEI